MESLSIAPAIALMLPALGPFFLVYLLLRISQKAFLENSKKRVLFSDLAILAGIFLVFGIFDSSSIRHILNPDRPMDWIPLLASFVFIARAISAHVPLILQESGTTALSLLLLLFPLLRQMGLAQAVTTFSMILACWLVIRFLYPVKRDEGVEAVFLLPLILTSSTLAFISPLSGSLLIGQLGAGIAAVLGAVMIAVWREGTKVTAIEPGWVLGALLVVEREYVEISTIVIGCLAGSLFLGAIAGRIGGGLGWKKIWKGFLITAMSAGPLLLGVLETLKNTGSQGSGY